MSEQFSPEPNLRLMEQVRQVIRYHHYKYRTEQTYCNWILRFIRFHGAKTHPRDIGKREEISPVKAGRYRRPPVVLTKSEVPRLLSHIYGVHLLMAQLLFGSGLRLMACVRFRIQNIDLERRRIQVVDGKGGKDRQTLIPEALPELLQLQIERVRRMHPEDIRSGCGSVYIPHAVKSFSWQYMFPSKKLSTDPRSGIKRRHHILESGLQKAVKRAVDKTGILRRIGRHTLRHCFATHALDDIGLTQ